MSRFDIGFYCTFVRNINTYIMKKEYLEQLVKDLMEMNKYLVKENEELKIELKRQRGVFLESIEKWDKSVERLTKQSVIRHSLFIYKSHTIP